MADGSGKRRLLGRGVDSWARQFTRRAPAISHTPYALFFGRDTHQKC